MIGSSLGPYKIIEPLGAAGMGEGDSAFDEEEMTSADPRGRP